MAMADVCLHGARAITLAGPSRAAVTLRAGHFGGTLGTGTLRLDLGACAGAGPDQRA